MKVIVTAKRLEEVDFNANVANKDRRHTWLDFLGLCLATNKTLLRHQ